MSASSTCSRSLRSASTASSWLAGRRTRNTRSSRRCARPPRWCRTRCRSASSSSRCCCASARSISRRSSPRRTPSGACSGGTGWRCFRGSSDLYEVSIGFVIITVLLCVGSLNLSAIVAAQDTKWGLFGWYWLPLFPVFIIFFISALAETNRPPFDLVEAESELVAGFMVEYGSTPYMMFMLGEYVAIATMCAMTTILFLGGWLPPFPIVPFTWVPGVIWFVLKALFVLFMFALVKAFVPRYRYDQLMRLGDRKSTRLNSSHGY